MKLKTLTIAVTLASAASIFAVAAYNGEKMNTVASPVVDQAVPQYPDVAIVEVARRDYRATITGHGEAKPRYQLDLTTEVSGQVETLADRFETGVEFEQGEALVNLNQTDHHQAISSAKASVADAKLALLEEQRQGQQAQKEWKRSGLKGQPDSSLVLREPQLKAAEAKLEKAKRELEKAKRDLSKTTIRAPFNALIVSREVQPGSYLQAGSAIAMLYSTDRIEVSIPMSGNQWLNLPPISSLNKEKWPVELTSTESHNQWRGYVERVEQHLNSASRQRSLIVVVEQPLQQTTPLYAGTFVEAKVQGRKLSELWQLPASAISQTGEIWLVDDKQSLFSVRANKQFEDSNYVYVVPPDDVQQAKVVVRPLNSYVQGMYVQPVVEG